MSAQDVVDRDDRAIAELIHETNQSAASVSASWVVWIALLAFFVVALAGVTHRDLLTETPVDLPLLQVKIPQASFFLFAPAFLVLFHLHLMMQHVSLARRLLEVDRRLLRREGSHGARDHRLRNLIHTYALAQAMAGPWRSPVQGFFLHAMTWVTLVLAPLLVLLSFHITYLPLHDAGATGLHRAYLAADVLVIALLGPLILVPDGGFRGAVARAVGHAPLALFGSGTVAGMALLVSLLVATIPDERLDQIATRLWPTTIEGAGGEGAPPPRQAFAPTVALFDGPVDQIAGRPSSPFARNLVVVATPLVAPLNPEPDDASLSLRGRNLRYATFDRSDMRRVDFTGADLTGASLAQTTLIKARLIQATLRNADLRGAGLVSTQVRGAIFEGARLCAEARPIVFGQDELKGLVRVSCPR